MQYLDYNSVWGAICAITVQCLLIISGNYRHNCDPAFPGCTICNYKPPCLAHLFVSSTHLSLHSGKIKQGRKVTKSSLFCNLLALVKSFSLFIFKILQFPYPT